MAELKKSDMVNMLSQHLIDVGFDSLYNQHLRLMRSRLRYKQVRKERGADVAESELTRRLSPVVADSVRPIATEVLDILLGRRNIQVEIFNRQKSDFPFPLPERSLKPQGIAIFNPVKPMNAAVRGYDDFGLEQALGLRAVVIAMDDHYMSNNEVSLIFNDKRPNPRPNGMTYVRLSRIGLMDAGAMSLTPEDVLNKALGIKVRHPHEAHRLVGEVLPVGPALPERLAWLVKYLSDIKHVLELEKA